MRYASYTLLKVVVTPLDAVPIISKMTISKSTTVLSRDFRNLKTHVNRHFENEVYLKNGYDWQEKENHKSKCEIREHGAGKRIATLCRLPNWVI